MVLYLIQAAEHTDPCMRLAYLIGISAFNLNSLAVDRWRKPFNSLLGETFEYISE
jgi:hypothetical protein